MKSTHLFAPILVLAKTSIILTVGILTICMLFIFFFREPLISVFISDTKVIIEGSKLIQITSISVPFFGMFFITGAIANGSGYTKFFAILSIIRLWILRIGLSILLALTMGLGSIGIWLAMCVSNVGSGLAALAWISKGTWLKKVIEIPAKRYSRMLQ